MSARWRWPAALGFVGVLHSADAAIAADACRELVKNKQLPMDSKTVSRSKLGPAELVILSNGKCTCNDMSAVQRSLGQAQPDGVFWACDVADADDMRAK